MNRPTAWLPCGFSQCGLTSSLGFLWGSPLLPLKKGRRTGYRGDNSHSFVLYTLCLFVKVWDSRYLKPPAPGSPGVGLSLFLTHIYENIKWKLQLPRGQEKHWDLSFNSKYLLSIVFQFLSRCLECTNEQNRQKQKPDLHLWSSHFRGIFFKPMWMIVSNSSLKWYLMGRGIDKVGEPQMMRTSGFSEWESG